LYKRLPSQCKQCGIRFSDSESGKQSMDAHLDMHFKQNLKATQNVGRGHSRSWFVGVEVRSISIQSECIIDSIAGLDSRCFI
jgi:pre-mRNA cleavage complex 2 protein Pcf11